jgi:magnesium-transporting ATPase (P-type)
VESAPSPVRLLVAQLVHFFALLLWGAAVLALVGGLPQLAVAIAVVVVLNGVFAFVQEYRADRAAEALRDLVPHRVTVLRDGVRQEVDAVDVVTGDVLALAAGDRLAADLRITEVHGLRVDESSLTGESEPVAKDAGDAASAGCFVVEGEGWATVEAIGSDTRLASISTMTRSTARAKTPLAPELHRVVRVVTVIAVGLGIVCFGTGVVLGLPITDGFLFAVGVTVALVPEGLLPTVTLPGPRRTAARAAARAGPASGVGGDTRLDHLHLHRQDRHAHAEPDGRGGGLDAGGTGRRLRRGVRPHSPARRDTGGTGRRA